MKIVFSDDAAHEYRTLQMLADKDPNAKELFFRLSAVLADIIKMPDINDSLIGKTEHHDRARKVILAADWKGALPEISMRLTGLWHARLMAWQ